MYVRHIQYTLPIIIAYIPPLPIWARTLKYLNCLRPRRCPRGILLNNMLQSPRPLHISLTRTVDGTMRAVVDGTVVDVAAVAALVSNNVDTNHAVTRVQPSARFTSLTRVQHTSHTIIITISNNNTTTTNHTTHLLAIALVSWPQQHITPNRVHTLCMKHPNTTQGYDGVDKAVPLFRPRHATTYDHQV
jgi:hypothetical protein